MVYKNEDRMQQLFVEQYQRLKAELYGYCLYCTANETEAEDLLQEACFRLYEALQLGRKTQMLKPYLLKIIKNTAANLSRSRQRKQRALQEVVKRKQGVAAETPEQRLASEEDAERLQQAMQQIPDEQAEVIALRYWGGLSFKEIADIMASNESTVTNRCQYGLKKLAEFLSGSQGE